MSFKKIFFVLCMVLPIFLLSNMASATTSVALNEPVDNNVFTTTNNITFNCSFSSDNYIKNISLYHNIDGSFSLNQTRFLGEIPFDSSMVLHMHFNNDSSVGENDTYVYDWSDNGNSGIVLGGIPFNSSGGKFFGAFEFDGDGSYINVAHDESINLNETYTIEFWLKTNDISKTNWILSKGDKGYSPYTAAVSTDGSLKWYIGSGSGSDSYILNSGPVIEVGKWYYVAVTWYSPTGDAKMYINGTLMDYSHDPGFPVGKTTDPLTIGHDPEYSVPSNWWESLNGSIDEFIIYNRVLSEDEIQEHYNNSFLTKQIMQTWTLNNIPDGTYKWNCRAFDYELSSKWSQTNYTFSVDMCAPPHINEIILNPNSSDDIDPGVNISIFVNASDPSNVSAVILQYKSPLASSFINDTMDYNPSTGLWENGTIVTTVSDIGNWSYRVWSNDTNGNVNMSDTHLLPVEWDKTWSLVVINSSGEVSDNFGTVSGFKETTQTLGRIIVNNTGDYSLSFDITSSSQSIYLTYNVSLPFDLSPKMRKDIEVNATIPETPAEYSVTLNITSNGATPEFREANSTVISFIGGPYINETTEISDYPISITQGEYANFTGYVKNIGNETAINVWLNWSFPSGWDVVSGSLNNMIGNLTSQESTTVTIVMRATSSATAGAATIWLNSSAQGTAGSDYKTIIIECNSDDGVCGTGCTYLTDSDCSAPSGGGGGAAVVGVSLKPELLLFAPDRIDLTKGETYKLSLKVSNTNAKNITKIKWGISGYPETLVKEEKPLVTYIPERKNKTIILEIDAPPYIEEKDYFVTISVGGLYNSKYIEDSKKIIFSVHGIVENESLNAINDAKISIEKMKKLGFKYDILEGLLEEANVAYNNLDFDKANELAQKIIDFQEKALETHALINQLKSDITLAEKYNIDVSEAKKMTTLAEYAFKRGDYKRAENRITSAMVAYQMETKDILPLMQFLSKYWFVFLILIILILFFRKRLVLRLTEARLKKIVKNKKTLKNLIKNLQKDYFINKKISKFDYILRKQNYEKRMAQIISEEAKTFKKIALLKGKTRKEGLILEKEILEKRIKEIQGDYFKRKKIGKNEYKEILEEIQREIVLVEKDIKKIDRKKLKTFLIIFLLFIIFSSNVNAEKYTLDDALKVIKDAEGVIAEMKETGLGTDYANHTLQEAKLSLSRNDYDAAVTQARYVFVIKEKALYINEMIDETESKIYELSSRGYDTSKANELFQTSLSEFESENYEEAEKLLNQAADNLDEIERKETLSKASESIFNKLKEAVIKNWMELTISAFIILLISLSAWWKVKKVLRVKKIRELENEIESLKKSIKHLQEKYFIRKTISRKNYDIGMSEYKKYLNNLMEELETLKKI